MKTQIKLRFYGCFNRGSMARLDSKNILEIISKNDEQIYIPIYQRNYDWKAENSEKLLLDI